MPQYREATHADIAAICALGEEVNAVHHRAFPHIFAGAGDGHRDAEHWMNSISKQDATTFVAEESNIVVGFVNIFILHESHTLLQPLCYGRVGSVGVHEHRRGEGIGHELMQQAEAWVLSRGGVELRLNVWAFNSKALRMYEELGYETRSLSLVKRLANV